MIQKIRNVKKYYSKLFKSLGLNVFICMHYLIYKITNKLNGKIYVGKHKTENENDEYFGSGLLLERAITKYGKDNFSKEIVYRANSLEDMNKMETDIVDEDFVARSDTYNLKIGGDGGWDYILKNRLWLTDKWYESMKNNWKCGREKLETLMEDEEFRNQFSKKVSDGLKLFHVNNQNSFKGRKHTDESKNKMRSAKTGKCDGPSNNMFGRMWINDGLKSITIKKTEQIPEGFKKGRLPKMLS